MEFVLMLLFLWIPFAVLARKAAIAKCLDAAKGFWAGLLLGPLGLFAVLLWPAPLNRVPAARLIDARARQCDECLSINARDAFRCRGCGAPQSSGGQQAESASASEPVSRAPWPGR